MRFDLTPAAYRVLERASRCRLPNGLAEIGAAKLLIALFEEEECRAADWLAEAGLTLDSFRAAFGLLDETSALESPISAPPFPMGSYGISPGQPRAVEFGPQKMELSAAAGDAPPFPADVPDHSVADQWTETAPESKHYGTYSIYQGFSTESAEQNRGEPILFFLDDRSVRVGRLSKELESTLLLLLHRFGKRKDDPRFPPLGDGAIPNFRIGLSTFSLATEHLLLAAALDESDVGRWLHDNGFDPTTLFQRIEASSVSTERSTEPFAEPQNDLQTEISALDEIKSTASEPFLSAHRIPQTAYRISRLLDAVSNRASEALRVIEDYVRFVLDDRSTTAKLKEFRHELRKLLVPFSNAERLSARDTEQDVGTELEGGGEYERRGATEVLSANFGRLQESLRSLEEFSKIETPQLARQFERLRYRSYTLHKTVLRDVGVPTFDTTSSLLESARLYVLLDAGTDEAEFREKVRALIADGVDVIQLRDKTADDRTLLDRARILRELTRQAERGVLFVMNDRPDLAKLAEADGVHVGQEELSVREVRAIVGDGMLVGVSTHDIGQARTALRDGADYLGAGPVFPSSTKDFERFPGLDFLRQVAAEIGIPVFAIGGIDLDNLPRVLETGVRRIAVGGAGSQAGQLKAALQRAGDEAGTPAQSPDNFG